MGAAKSAITKLTNRLKKEGYEIERSHGYRHSTAFVNKNGFYVYISADDDRNNFLIRTAKSNKDFTGGQNNFVEFSLTSKNGFDKAIKLTNRLLNQEIMRYLDSNSVVEVDYPIVTLTYDLGDLDDAGRFKDKFDKATDSDKFKELNIPYIELLPDEENTWTIANVDIDISELKDKSLLKEFIKFTDSI